MRLSSTVKRISVQFAQVQDIFYFAVAQQPDIVNVALLNGATTTRSISIQSISNQITMATPEVFPSLEQSSTIMSPPSMGITCQSSEPSIRVSSGKPLQITRCVYYTRKVYATIHLTL